MDRAPGKVLNGGNMPSWNHAGATGTGAATATAATTTPARKTASATSVLYSPFGQAQNGVSAATAAAPMDESGMNQRAIEVAMLGQTPVKKRYGQYVAGQTEEDEKEDEQEERQQKKAVQSFMQRLENPQIYDIMETERRGMEYGKELLDKELKELSDKELLDKNDAWLEEQARKLDDLRLWVKREKRSPELMRDMHAV